MEYRRLGPRERLFRRILGRGAPPRDGATTERMLGSAASVQQLPSGSVDCPTDRWQHQVLPWLGAMDNSSLQAVWQLANEEVRRCRAAPPGSFLAHVLTALGAEFTSRKLEPDPERCEPETVVDIWMARLESGCVGQPNCCQEHAFAVTHHTTAPTMGYFEEAAPAPETLMPMSIACRSVALQLLLRHLPGMDIGDLGRLQFLVESHHRGHDPAIIVPGSLLVRAVNAVREELEGRDAAAVKEACSCASDLVEALMLARERRGTDQSKAASAAGRATTARKDMEEARRGEGADARRRLCAASAALREAENSPAAHRVTTTVPFAASVSKCQSRPLEIVAKAILVAAEGKARAANEAAASARAALADRADWDDWVLALSLSLPDLARAIVNWHSCCLPEFPVLQALLYMCQHAADFLRSPEQKDLWIRDLVKYACTVWDGKPPPGSLLEALTAPQDGAQLVEGLAATIAGAAAH